MDEFGDWIYIILMVVVGVSSLISSANKKKKQQQMQMPLPEPSEISEPLEPWHPTTSPVPKKKEKKVPHPVQQKVTHPSFRADLTFPTIETASQTEIYLAAEEENTFADELELTDADDFRKAVIYSEILNRRY